MVPPGSSWRGNVGRGNWLFASPHAAWKKIMLLLHIGFRCDDAPGFPKEILGCVTSLEVPILEFVVNAYVDSVESGI